MFYCLERLKMIGERKMIGKKLLLFFIVSMLIIAGCSFQDDKVTILTPEPTPQPTPTLLPTPEPTPQPTPEPTPEPTPDPYFPDAEEVEIDEDNGYWLYRSPTLFVEVNRIVDEEGPKTYFVADIRFKEDETERAGFANPDKPGRSSRALYKIAANYQAVIAVNGDYMANVRSDKKGIVMRDGIVYADKKQTDTLAFYPDGTMRIIRPGEVTPEQLAEDGVRNTFSFGPTLINNGEIEPGLERARLARRNPRTAVGMIEPYHYLLVVVDGRKSRYSIGMTLPQLAQLFASYDCQVAYNLDGGQSATMSFMAKNISRYKGSLKGQRSIPDALMFGFTPLLEED